MPVRLLKPYDGQAAGTTYWSPGNLSQILRSTGIGDDQFELATDYQQYERDVTTASVNVVSPVLIFNMNSASAQTVNLGLTGWLPKGAILTVVQLGAGQSTVVPGAGIIVNTALTSLVTKAQYSVGNLLKVGPTNWIAYGGFGG